MKNLVRQGGSDRGNPGAMLMLLAIAPLWSLPCWTIEQPPLWQWRRIGNTASKTRLSVLSTASCWEINSDGSYKTETFTSLAMTAIHTAMLASVLDCHVTVACCICETWGNWHSRVLKASNYFFMAFWERETTLFLSKICFENNLFFWNKFNISVESNKRWENLKQYSSEHALKYLRYKSVFQRLNYSFF